MSKDQNYKSFAKELAERIEAMNIEEIEVFLLEVMSPEDLEELRSNVLKKFKEAQKRFRAD